MYKLSLSIDWFDKHSEFAYSFIRIFLGFALFVRGLILSFDPSLITQLTGASHWYWWYSYVIIAHIICGVMLGIGLLTRLAAFLQIPILIGAIFVFHLKAGLVRVEQSLELSTLVFVLLIIYSLFGSGSLSMDHYLARKRDTN
ncbi:MAG: DoxX family protein [Melioribacteraceae bacterium]|nr:DoxX family protein [Melioribacteraceae bacterium]MCO6474867.1 DoxX family protein [Melioribacteraceae bacterium]